MRLTIRILIVAAILLGLLAGVRIFKRHKNRIVVPGGIAFGSVNHPNFGTSQAAVREHIQSSLDAFERTIATNPPPHVKAQAFAELGRIYFAYEHFEAAAGCFTNAVALAPNDPRTWYGLAECRFQLSQITPAIEAMDFARAYFEFIKPRPIQEIGYAQRFLGDAFERAGNLPEATKRFQAVLASEPNDLYSLIKLGRIFGQSNDRTNSIAVLEKARSLAASNREIATLLSLEYRKAGRTAEADALTATLQASAARRVQEMQRPDPWVTTARALNKSSAAIYRAGIDAMRAGQHLRAADVFEKVIAADPNNVSARVSLGYCKLALNDPVAAGEIFLGVVNYENKNEPARKGLALALAQTGRGEDAVRFCEAWQKSEPKNSVPIETEAEVRVYNRDYKGAANAFQRLIQLAPSSGIGPMGLANVQARLGLHKEARQTLEASIVRLQNRAELQHLLARILVASPSAEVRDPARALQITQTLVNDSAIITIWETHALALAANNRWDDASKIFEAALARFGGAGAPALVQRLTKVRHALRDRTSFTEPWPFAEDQPATKSVK